jgi:hypothetical protein
MTNDEITKKDYLLGGQALDPNPTRARTFILGEGYVPTERERSATFGPEDQRALIDSLKETYPHLTDEDILDFL